MEKDYLKRLTILHSNDLHGDFLVEREGDKLIGGVSMLSGYINSVRSEEKNVIYAIAGDMFRGSVIDSEYKGISTIEIMNALAPDVVTIGNHEIDYGIAHLLFIEKCASFPIINANLYIKTNGVRLFSPYFIMNIDGLKIMFIGVITHDVMAQAKTDELISAFIDTTDAAREINKLCNSHRDMSIDYCVLLTHIGFEHDKELARLLDPSLGVNLIIGGHSHTRLEKPEVINGISIVQAGTGTDLIGRMDLIIDTRDRSVVSSSWSCVPIDDTHCPRDRQLEELVGKYKSITDIKYARIVTRFARELTHPKRNAETSLGNLFADIFKESLGVDIMLLASGSIRREKLGPIVQYGALVSSFPFDDAIYILKLSGRTFRKIIQFVLRDDAFLGLTEFYQISRSVRVIYSKARHKIESLTFHGSDIKDDDILSVGMQSFHFNNLKSFFGIDFNEAGALQQPRVISTSCIDILEEYLSGKPSFDSEVEGRITIIE